MSSAINYLPFDARTVPLCGSNLIEASAGTGKTYSIAIMVLRLVMEDRVSPTEILMVTFTKAAVAELSERVRLFIRKAYKCSRGEDCDDPLIGRIVAEAQAGADGDTVEKTLYQAALLLDELPVTTIHSFCQTTLSEFAFETAHAFAPEMLPSLKPMAKDLFHKFWRRHINTLPPALLRQLDVEELRDSLGTTVESHLDNRLYYGFEEGKEYSLSSAETDEWLSRIGESGRIPQLLDAAYKGLYDAYQARKANGPKLGHIEAAKRPYMQPKSKFVAAVAADYPFVEKNFPETLPAIDELLEAVEGREDVFAEIHQRLRYWAISEILKNVAIIKKKANLITFSDMISELHAALTKPDNEALVTGLRKKYKAAFIDEFQDTDRRQYEIFNAAFGEETILFLIGDPKQSIYGFRTADVATYFEARSRVQNVYSMDRNFRSAARLIDAMNIFFKPTPDFQTFAFDEDEEGFEYIPVESPENNPKEGVFLGETPEPCISIRESENKNDVHEKAALQVAGLLRSGFLIKEKGTLRKIRPSDIGVLVRTGTNGRAFKARLAALNIPAVYRDEARILDTPQAGELVLVLQAILEPSGATINRALLNTLLPFTNDALLKLDDEVVVARFAHYRQRWAEHGILPALTQLAHDFSLRNWLMTEAEDGHRTYANFLQLAELLHATQMRRKLSETELISWLQRAISDPDLTQGDTFLQRLERDDEAVEITTIHKSKGLEYNIVIAPDVNWKSSLGAPYRPTLSYREPETGRYFFIEQARCDEAQKSLFAAQEEQENRRLLYVTVTRAVHGCYLFTTTRTQDVGKTAAVLMPALKACAHPEIVFDAPIPPLQAPPETETETLHRYTVLPKLPNFQLPQAWWRRLSYSGISGGGEYFRLQRARAQENPYDAFVFETLPRSSKTGEMLHYLLERALPDQRSNWPWAVGQTLSRFMPAKKEAYTPLFLELMAHISGAQIAMPGGEVFSLQDVSYEKRLAELEFDFPVSPFQLEALRDAARDADIPVALRETTGRAEGIMNGKIDLFFEREGKYYLLDWKSNYLGDTLEAYSPAALADVMRRANYHLQYLIYTLAAKKYLSLRLPGFDYDRDFGGVVYLFARGVRQDSDSGIFTAKPAAALVQKLEGLFSAQKESKV